MPPATVRLRASAEALAAGGPRPGRAWCAAWTAEVDAALVELLAASTTASRVAVAGTGGYGRGELAPGSDVDLLLLHDGVGDAPLEELVRSVVYPLWDAGLTVGYAVRGRREAAGVGDLDSVTATLDLRHVAGDRDLTASVRADLLDRLVRRPGRFLDDLAAADAERRARRGDVAEVLEPDLRDGAGGLRDVQSLRWAAAAVSGTADLDALVTRHVLSAVDRGRLTRAEDLLLAIRVALHLAAGRRTDVLSFDRQDDVATRLGRGDGAALLHELFLAARTVDHVHRTAWALLRADAAGPRRLRRPPQRVLPGGLALAGGVLRLDDDAALDDPGFPLLLLDALATTEAALDRRSADRIVRVAPDAPWRWDGDGRRRFLDVLRRGGAVDALAELDDLGLLERLLPEWAPVRGRPQRNPFHRYSLDRHAFHAIDELARVTDEPWAAAVVADVADTDALVLATLLHDVGKAYGEPHADTGAPVGEAVAARVGCPPDTVAQVGQLVRLHLLLPEVATRRDLEDPALLAEVATAVGDRSTLASLHLLAAADGRATGPSAWTAWKAALVADLVAEVRAVLDGGAVAASGRPASPAAPGPADVGVQVTPGRIAGVDELEVLARDRPGLFAAVAGVLALHGGSVLAARATTGEGGVAVETFSVARPGVDGWWAAVEADVAAAVAGRLALRARLARRATAIRPRPRPGPSVRTRVVVEPDPSGATTVVEVHTEDRLGVLHAVAAALAELQLDIVTARVDTVGDEAIDVFYVRDVDGCPLDDAYADEVVLAVRSAVDA